MKYAFQVPKPHLDDFIHEADFFFALAHHVLMDEDYSNWFLQRPTMLDNGAHEMGMPVMGVDLVEAAKLIEPEWIIPPDYLFNQKATLKGFYDFAELMGSAEKLAPVIQGRTLKELQDCMDEYVGKVNKVCIPYRLSSAIRQWVAYQMYRYTEEVSIHFLGVNNLEELRILRFFPNSSIDTGKPFRWAQQGKVWPDGKAPNKLDMTKSVEVNFAKLGIMNMKKVTEFETK
jgi:hypothetical protein